MSEIYPFDSPEVQAWLDELACLTEVSVAFNGGLTASFADNHYELVTADGKRVHKLT